MWKRRWRPTFAAQAFTTFLCMDHSKAGLTGCANKKPNIAMLSFSTCLHGKKLLCFTSKRFVQQTKNTNARKSPMYRCGRQMSDLLTDS